MPIFNQKFVVSVLVATFFLSPLTMYAQTVVFQPRTQQELIAYLYGQVVQLQLFLESGQYCDCDDSSSRENGLEVTTRSAERITDDSAELIGRVTSETRQSVRAWFEYDTSRDLDDRSATTRISLSSDTTREVKIRIDDLNDDDVYYYRFVVEDEDGEEVEGSVRSFTTDEDGSRDDDDDSDYSDYRLDLDDDEFSRGEQIAVDFELPSSAVSGTNWIGLFRIGSVDTSYQDWKYIGGTDDGTVYFTVSSAGEYEFRLFLNNGYTRVAESDEFTVE
jgi:hypothetical protein